jgi:sirohydrochlorin cobaltochelatase
MTDTPTLLIVGHGSRSTEGARQFHEFAALVRARAPGLNVGAGFIELAPPVIGEEVARLVAAGVREIAAVPLMLLAAGHTKDDIPATLLRERLRHRGLTIHYGRELGIRPELLALVEERVDAVLAREHRAETAVILVGRGTTDPDANGDLAKVARLFYEGRGFLSAEPAFVSLAEPSVPAVLERCRRLGAERVVVAPYFLFTGVLVERIREQARAFAAEHGVDVRCAEHLGPAPALADLVVERYREALAGDARMNCDLCVHRVALPGFEHKVGAPATPHHHPDEGGGDHSHAHHHAGA